MVHTHGAILEQECWVVAIFVQFMKARKTITDNKDRAKSGCLLPIGKIAREREATEWIVAYRYNSNEFALPRVLLVGDSICNGYQEGVRDKLAGFAYVSFFASSRCLTDPAYLVELLYFLGQDEYSVVHFNNGLHSLKTNRQMWQFSLGETLEVFHKRAAGARIIWASSTPTQKPELTARVVELNSIAERAMAEHHVPIDDLFTLMDPMDRSKYWVDDLHFNVEAKRLQAQAVATCVLSAMDSSV